jgi:hypothetical protein
MVGPQTTQCARVPANSSKGRCAGQTGCDAGKKRQPLYYDHICNHFQMWLNFQAHTLCLLRLPTLPVTTPGEKPLYLLYSSKNHHPPPPKTVQLHLTPTLCRIAHLAGDHPWAEAHVLAVLAIQLPNCSLMIEYKSLACSSQKHLPTLPVTTPGEKPLYLLYSSKNHHPTPPLVCSIALGLYP